MDKISFPLLKTIMEAQAVNGIQHRDYEQYRTFCSRKLKRLRRKGDCAIEELVFLAERAWAFAMELRQKETCRSLSHLRSRLAKAVKWASKLKLVSAESVDAQTALEIEGYLLWMQGTLYIERNEVEKALVYFGDAKKVYQSLADLGAAEERILFEERIKLIEPNLRYCHYVLEKSPEELLELSGEKDDLLQSKIEKVLDEARHKQAAVLDHIQWKQQRLPLKSEELRLFLLKSDEDEKLLSDCENEREREALYSNLLAIYAKALSFIDEQIGIESAKSSRTLIDEQGQHELVQLKEYIYCRQLRKILERDQFLASGLESRLDIAGGKSGRPDDLVGLYDKLMQSATVLLETGDFSADEGYKRQLEVDVLRYKICRLMFRAQSYSKVGMYKECVVLLEKAEFLCAHSTETDIQKLRRRCQKYCVLAKTESILSSEEKDRLQSTPLQDRLEESSLSMHLVDLPPSFESVPLKPVLYDLAWNYIEFPDVSSRSKKHSSGLFGITLW